MAPEDCEDPLQAQSEKTEDLIRRLAAWLPSQGPITAFAFLNPLQGMEDQPFFEALRAVKDVYGCEPFLQENAYRRMIAHGRITIGDLKDVLSEEPSTTSEQGVAALFSTVDLRLSMLRHSINPGTENELRWELGGLDAIRRFRADVSPVDRDNLIRSTCDWVTNRFQPSAESESSVSMEELEKTVQKTIVRFRLGPAESLEPSAWETVCLSLLWRIVRTRMKSTPRVRRITHESLRHRDLLLDLSSEDSDEWVHPVLGRFCSAYLDQGYAHWQLPSREKGFFDSFLLLFSSGGSLTSKWLRPLGAECKRLLATGVSAIQSLEESLQQLGIGPEKKESYLSRSLLAQRGWAGMIWQTETRPDRVYLPSPEGTLTDYLAARLLIERFALVWISRSTLGYHDSLDRLYPFLASQTSTGHTNESIEQRSYPILQLAQLHGWSPQRLVGLSKAQWGELVSAVETFSSFERRRVFHLAFERHLTQHTLDAISIRASLPHRKPVVAKLQVITCIDAREESFRRHLEEIEPDAETYGNAGFFNVPMYFRGAGEAFYSALCPVVMKPQNWVIEDVVLSLVDTDRQRANARRWIGNATPQFNTRTRGSISGAILTAILGPLFTAPLVGRIIFPRLTAMMHRTARGLMATPPVTRLRLERPAGIPAGPDDDGVGFTFAEMAEMGERALRDIGLTKDFARLIIILGHGSHCLNNPHESAYHCGACSGAPGSANARALAAILNDRRIRIELLRKGITIPEETHFVGGSHNTATEAIRFYDLELLPTSHVRDLKKAMEIFARVAERNAHERCRRFETAPLDLTPSEALHHVEDRSEDLAQTRPEYGNSTNAICFVGRRNRLRGLYLDRRSFLMSYDASQDTPGSELLARILAAVIPVCRFGSSCIVENPRLESLQYTWACLWPLSSAGYCSSTQPPSRWGPLGYRRRCLRSLRFFEPASFRCISG